MKIHVEIDETLERLEVLIRAKEWGGGCESAYGSSERKAAFVFQRDE